MLMLEELSQNRDLEQNVKEGERMLTEVNYEKLPSYLLGFEIGEERGVEKGIEKGRIEGVEKGIEKGEKQKAIAIAKKLLLVNIDIDLIVQTTDLTKEEVLDLAKETK